MTNFTLPKVDTKKNIICSYKFDESVQDSESCYETIMGTNLMRELGPEFCPGNFIQWLIWNHRMKKFMINNVSAFLECSLNQLNRPKALNQMLNEHARCFEGRLETIDMVPISLKEDSKGPAYMPNSCKAYLILHVVELKLISLNAPRNENFQLFEWSEREEIVILKVQNSEN